MWKYESEDAYAAETKAMQVQDRSSSTRGQLRRSAATTSSLRQRDLCHKKGKKTEDSPLEAPKWLEAQPQCSVAITRTCNLGNRQKYKIARLRRTQLWTGVGSAFSPNVELCTVCFS